MLIKVIPSMYLSYNITSNYAFYPSGWFQHRLIYTGLCRRSDGTVRWVRYGPSFWKRRHIFVFWPPYFIVQTVKYGMVYGTVPSWHCQCNFGLRMASPPQHLPFSPPACSSHVLKPHNASLDDPEAGIQHAPARTLTEKEKRTEAFRIVIPQRAP